MPTALLVHGIGSGPATMWRLADWLGAAGWTVTSHALLGHGGRPAAPSYTLDAYADDLIAAGDFDLVIGHSLGGAAATRAVALRPGWTKRLIVIDPAWRVGAEGAQAAKAAELAELEHTREQLVAEHPDWDPRDIDAKLAEAKRALPEAVAATFDDNPGWDLVAEARALPIPTMLLTGDPHRALVDAELAGEVRDNRHVTWERIAGAGHAPHRDDPGATQVTLLEWLYTSS